MRHGVAVAVGFGWPDGFGWPVGVGFGDSVQEPSGQPPWDGVGVGVGGGGCGAVEVLAGGGGAADLVGFGFDVFFVGFGVDGSGALVTTGSCSWSGASPSTQAGGGKSSTSWPSRSRSITASHVSVG